MSNKYILPKRTAQHISESESYKILASQIPSNWIVRDITERDYGIDCYIELVDEDNCCTGDIALVQLKGRGSIEWTKEDTYTLSGVEVSTTNYWKESPIPVFLFLTDNTTKELFFISVDLYIRQNFLLYNKQDKFNYMFRKEKNAFKPNNSTFQFRFYYFYQKDRSRFESELTFFLTNIKQYDNYQDHHSNSDDSMELELDEIIFFEAMHVNYEFLCNYLNIEYPVPSLEEIKRGNEEKKMDSWQMLELDITVWMKEYKDLTSKIVEKLKQITYSEAHYWIVMNHNLYSYIQNYQSQQLAN